MADPDPLLRSLGITLKPPFDWGHERTATLDSPQSIRVSTNAASAPLSGLESLKNFLREDRSSDSSDAGENDRVKDVLRTLLSNSGISLPAEDESEAATGSKPAKKKDRKRPREDLLRDVSIRGLLSDRAVGELTVEGKTSLFGSVLRMFDLDGSHSAMKAEELERGGGYEDDEIGSGRILATAEIVRTCHLAARPGDVPPGMDSKEYTMAALHFLSSNVPFLTAEDDLDDASDSQSSMEGKNMLRLTFPVLPLLKVINPEENLEKRSYARMLPLATTNGIQYRRDQPESMDLDVEFRRRVLNVERAYASSLPFNASSNTAEPCPPHAFQHYVARRKLCPRLGGVKEELTLIISGHLGHPLPSLIAADKKSPVGTGTSPVGSTKGDSKRGGKLMSGKKHSLASDIQIGAYSSSAEKPKPKKRKESSEDEMVGF